MRVIRIKPMEIMGRTATTLYSEFCYDGVNEMGDDSGYFGYEFYDADGNVIPGSYRRFDVPWCEDARDDLVDTMDSDLRGHLGIVLDKEHFECPIEIDHTVSFSCRDENETPEEESCCPSESCDYDGDE